MSEAIELVSLVVQDARQHVLLLHRSDHMQWQLPGGRMFDNDPLQPERPVETPEVAAARHALEELNIDVQVQRYIGQTTFFQGIALYSCEWRQAIIWHNDPILGDWEVYDDAQYFNPHKYSFPHSKASPNVRNFVQALRRGEINLTDD